MLVPTTYAIYLAISIALTVWVAKTLHKRGVVFLLDATGGKKELADSINDLLVVGFYLLNFGYVTLALKYGLKPLNVTEAIEFLATKVGLVLMILGVMHFFNIAVITKFGRKKNKREFVNAEVVNHDRTAGLAGR